jgi:hypothetical protein
MINNLPVIPFKLRYDPNAIVIASDIGTYKVDKTLYKSPTVVSATQMIYLKLGYLKKLMPYHLFLPS